MKQSRLLLILLQPSLLSFIFTGLSAAIMLLASSWSFLKTQPFFATYFSEDYGFHTLVADINATIGRALDALLPYNVVVLGFALVIGLIVLIILESVHHMHSQMSEAINEVKFADAQNKPMLEQNLEARIGLRAVTALAWLGYSLFFFNMLIPICTTLIAKNNTHTPVVGSASNLLAFVMLFVATHIHIVFARLLLLRPRIFGEDFVGRGGH